MLTDLAKTIPEKLDHIKSEEATKTAIVLPVLQALGWDTTDPREVTPEYKLTVEGREREAVDYALQIDGKIVAFIECKAANKPLSKGDETQLRNYYSATNANVGISDERTLVALLHLPQRERHYGSGAVRHNHVRRGRRRRSNLEKPVQKERRKRVQEYCAWLSSKRRREAVCRIHTKRPTRVALGRRGAAYRSACLQVVHGQIAAVCH